MAYASGATNIINGKSWRGVEGGVYLFDRLTGINQLITHQSGYPVRESRSSKAYGTSDVATSAGFRVERFSSSGLYEGCDVKGANHHCRPFLCGCGAIRQEE